MKILIISDKIIEHIYSNTILDRFKDIDFVISCGDLPDYYLEFIVSTLNKPLFYVMGNHDRNKVYNESNLFHDKEDSPAGCINLDGKIIEYKNITLMGLEGSMKYCGNKYQYTDAQMQRKINKIVPGLLFNKIFKNKHLDILVTHSPPFKIHDQEDLCHRGFKSFIGFIKKYKPKYLIHGHIHIYGTNPEWITKFEETVIINAYGYRVIEI
jgi:uncharacterized protein